MKKILAFFRRLSASPTPQSLLNKNLAAAALMVEAAAMDGSISLQEKQTIRSLLMEKLALEQNQIDALIAEALKQQSDATHLMRFTRTLKDTMSEEERLQIIEMLWRVAAVDGHIDDYEDNLIRRVAGLLYVSDRARGDARKRALQSLV